MCTREDSNRRSNRLRYIVDDLPGRADDLVERSSERAVSVRHEKVVDQIDGLEVLLNARLDLLLSVKKSNEANRRRSYFSILTGRFGSGRNCDRTVAGGVKMTVDGGRARTGGRV